MARGEDVPLEMRTVMPQREEVWQRIVKRHGLRPLTLAQLVGSSWEFTDRAFAYGLTHPANSVLSPIKLHQHGFHGCMDTEDSLHDWLERMQQNQLLPR
jgi:hypothetical protein